MADSYKGFRLFTRQIQHLDTTSSGVSVEFEKDTTTPTGRLLVNNKVVGYYPNSKYGVKALLEDTCAPLIKEEDNGVGWSLDTDLYTRLNNLSTTDDPVATTFKEKNPLLWTPTTTSLPNGNDAPKSVALVPCSYVYAMFFKHTSGYKLMVALNYTAMHSYYSSSTSSGGQNDAGWLYKHVHGYLANTSANHTRVGGFMMSMIPPANQGEPEDNWHPEFSIRSENWYPSTSFPIVAQFAPNSYYTNVYTSSGYNMYGGASLIRVGTSEAATSSGDSNRGCLVGTFSRVSLFADSKGNVGISTYRNYSGTVFQVVILGPLYKSKFNSNDTLPQRNLACFTRGVSRITVAPTSSSGSNSSDNAVCAWFDASERYITYLLNLNTSGNSVSSTVYASYPALSNEVYTNYRYAKALYTLSGLLDEEVIRASSEEGLILGQTFNGGEWCYIGGIPVNSGTGSTNNIYCSIRWDRAFNGNRSLT